MGFCSTTRWSCGVFLLHNPQSKSCVPRVSQTVIDSRDCGSDTIIYLGDHGVGRIVGAYIVNVNQNPHRQP